ncbi:MAG: NAD-dependent epimerase/dehydratase family protein [Candidatus Abyssobacteria bacterium SURF_17]|uniref:NAD-dependent epimerase/dehydratase family protein n=1 Tax=Candidatus Abyssobacteria bacterium SURF_17 TaxID=2093361 RepID=A0A419EY91_9BACT|nr:MAG: NAD-dependent epimerase/dehydratase family protein [Candidatus Abyssubacteria bacterium SURF_17]
MRVIVTGAAGFIGSSLTERLLALGHDVTGIDCLTDYYSPDMKRRNLELALAHPQFAFLSENLLDIDLSGLLTGCDVVFHQAAQAGVRASWGRDFETYTNNNVLATQRLLEAAKGSALKRFVFASSSSVYGDAEHIPVSEHEPLHPLSPYGVTKLAAENLCQLYHKNFGIPTVSLRYFTVFGPRQRPDMAFHKFIKALLRDEPIPVFGDGEQTRDFTFIDDAVEANILAMEKGGNGAIYNIGGGSRISLNRAIKLLESITGRKARRDQSSPQKGDVRHTWADTTRARTELSFVPRHDVREGLQKEYEWVNALYR